MCFCKNQCILCILGKILLKKLQMTNKMTRIIQENHKLYTVEVEKKSLSPFNDKKWVSREGDNFISYSYGHYKIGECAL